MVGFALSFMSGIAALHFLPFFPVSLVSLCIAAALFLLLAFRQQKKRAFLMIVIFVFGFFYSAARQPDLPRLSLPDRDVWITGIIADVPEVSNDRLYFTIDNIFIEGENIRGKARLGVSENLPEDKNAGYLFAPGSRISAIARLREPAVFRNPGVYSYDLKKDGIVAAGYIKQVRLTTGVGSGARAWIYKQRQRLGMIMDNSLPREAAAFLKSIVPGLKRGISPEMRDAFNSTGLAHLLSISGTHFGLLAVVLFMLIRGAINRLPVTTLTKMTLYITPTQTAIVLTLPVLALYALISGASVPTIRSLIMVFIFMLALFLGRKGQWLNSLSIAAFIILLWQPDALLNLSFRFSFLAVLSIGYVLEKRGENMEIKPALTGIKGIPGKIKTAGLITVSAVLGTAPLAAVYFKQFPLIAPLTNLIVTPLVCFIILPLGFFTGFFALIFNLPVMPASGLTGAITHFSLKLINLFSMVPYVNLRIHNPSFAITVLYYLSLVIIFKNRHGPDDRPAHYFRWRFLPLVLVLCIYIIGPYLSGGKLRATFLDVGQGDASVVELPDKRVMLIDGGRYEPDMGRMVVAPYLWSKGIRKVDYLVLSHPHPDHFGGLMYIMDNFDVGEVWLNGRFTVEAREFFEKIKNRKIPGRILGRGDVLEATGYKTYVFHPYDEFCANPPEGGPCNQNNDSLVLKIESDGLSILFTGDIEEEAEDDLRYLGNRLESDIIKVPHHGGRTSSSAEFIRIVGPRTAVISAGRNNVYRHPHRETLERYRNAGVNILRTDRDGAVTITFGDKSYKTETYRDNRFKKVVHRRDEIRNLKLLF